MYVIDTTFVWVYVVPYWNYLKFVCKFVNEDSQRFETPFFFEKVKNKQGNWELDPIKSNIDECECCTT